MSNVRGGSVFPTFGANLPPLKKKYTFFNSGEKKNQVFFFGQDLECYKKFAILPFSYVLKMSVVWSRGETQES
jgi:hypothetical protein